MKTGGYNSSVNSAKNKVYTILFIAESFSERQHLVSVRPCFHPFQQLDRALQHKEINQFAKVTQRVSDSFQIRPQESLAPWMPRIRHMTSGELNTFYRLQVDSSVLIFQFMFIFSGSQRIILPHFSPVGRSDSNLVPCECPNSLPSSAGSYSSGMRVLTAGKVRTSHTMFHSHWAEEDGDPKASRALCSGHSKCASRRHRKSWWRRGNVPGEKCHELWLLFESFSLPVLFLTEPWLQKMYPFIPFACVFHTNRRKGGSVS